MPLTSGLDTYQNEPVTLATQPPSTEEDYTDEEHEKHGPYGNQHSSPGHPELTAFTKTWLQTRLNNQRAGPRVTHRRNPAVKAYHDNDLGPGDRQWGGGADAPVNDTRRSSFERMLKERDGSENKETRLRTRSPGVSNGNTPGSTRAVSLGSLDDGGRRMSGSILGSDSVSSFRPQTKRTIHERLFVRERLRHYGDVTAKLTRDIADLQRKMDTDEVGYFADTEGPSAFRRDTEEHQQNDKHHPPANSKDKRAPPKAFDDKYPGSKPAQNSSWAPHERKPNQPPNNDFAHYPDRQPQFYTNQHVYQPKNRCEESDAYRVLEDVMNLGRPRGRNLLTKDYDPVKAYTREGLPDEPPNPPNGGGGGGGGGSGWWGGGGGRGEGFGGIGNAFACGDPEGKATTFINATTGVRLLFFRYHKGKVVKGNPSTVAFDESLDNELLARNVRLSYEGSKTWFSRLFGKIRFLYFIRVTYERDLYWNKVVNASYLDVMPYENNRTISRFLYLLDRGTKNDQSLTWNVLTMRRQMDSFMAVPYIYVEIVEGLSTRAILGTGLAAVVSSLASGVAYALSTGDWGDAFTFSALLVACFALVLGVVAVYQYLGFERLLDDEIAARSSNYRYHPGHFGWNEMNTWKLFLIEVKSRVAPRGFARSWMVSSSVYFGLSGRLFGNGPS